VTEKIKQDLEVVFLYKGKRINTRKQAMRALDDIMVEHLICVGDLNLLENCFKLKRRFGL